MNLIYLDSVGNPVFFIDGSASAVGLGTNKPAQKLTVQGTFNVTADGSAVNLFVASDGRVGIGTDTPSKNLEVSNSGAESDIQITSDANQQSTLYFNDGNTAIYKAASSDGLIFVVGTKDRVTINSSGNVGIGNSTPSERLYVEGNINVSGNIYANGCIQYDCGTGTCTVLGSCI